MTDAIYVFDTNMVTAIIQQNAEVVSKLRLHQSQIVVLCQPVDYEIRRGFLKRNALVQLRDYQTAVVPLFSWARLADSDWQQAAQFWADATAKGKQLSDMDLLIAAISKRLNGILVTADADFDALPILRENWRQP